MKHIIRIIIILMSCAIMPAACTTSTPIDTISRAEAALAEGDYDQARIVESLVSDTARADLQPSQLCRVALIYMHLAEVNKHRYDDDMAMAAQCYIRALQLNRDSVADFLQRMPVSELPAINTLNELACAITSPVDISESVAADTIPEDFHIPAQN